MYQSNESKRGLRSALLLGAASVAAMGFSVPASAQDSSTETVVVTGSRIPQQGLYSTSPVTAVGQQEVKLEGTINVSTLLNNLPSVFSGQTNFTGNASTGTATVDLRGLGSARTLVLIDGKRMAPGDPVVPVADLNQIPSTMIDHVEVLTGGASAVYGSDALAGVVNFIMRKDFEGVEFDGQYSVYQHDNNNGYLRGLNTAASNSLAKDQVWDGATTSGSLILGVNSSNGKGNITAYFTYQNTQQVLAGGRDLGSCSLNSKYTGHLDGSGRKMYDAFGCAGSFNKDAFYSLTGPGAGAYYFMQPGGTIVPFAGTADQYYNYGPVNSLQRPDTRYTAGAFAHYEVDPSLDVYANFMFADDHTTWQAAPSALFFGSGPAATFGAMQVNCDNPLAAGTDFQALFCDAPYSANTATVYIGRRNIEGGPRVTDFRHTSYRVVVGAKGDLGNTWSYDVSGQFSTSLYNQLYLHDLSVSRSQDALLVDPISGECISGNAGCVPLDIFHGVGGITQNMLGYVYTHGQQSGWVEERVLSGSLTGDLGQYGLKSPWAQGGVGLALGAEYRSEYIERTTSDADQHGDLFGSGGTDPGQARAGYSVTEGFGEIQIPVIQGQQFFEDLTVKGGYRYSSYSTAGAITSYKAEGTWQPVDDFRLRASYQRAVRAPNVLEIFSPQTAVLGSFEDPCAGAVPSATLAGCVASGLDPLKYGSLIQCPASQCKVLTGGNTSLKPEVSDTKSFGIVLTPTFIDGFTATVDYFDIRVNDYIGSVAATITLAQCTQLTNTALCPLIHRDANGFLFTDTGYVKQTNTNTGYLQTKGIDVEANYTTALSDWGLGENGDFSVNFVGSYVKDYLVEPYTGASATLGGKTYTNYDCVGYFGITCGTPTPEWRHRMRVTWSSPWDFDLSLAWRHMSGVKFDGNSDNGFIHQSYNLVAGGSIPKYDYFDLSGSWDVSDHVSLHGGVNNLFDKDPPTLASGGKTSGPTGPLNSNTFPGIYDPLGRYIFIGGTVKY